MKLKLDILFQLHRKELQGRLTRIVGCRETAADLVQESFLVYSRESAANEIRHPRGFLFRVATNLAYDHIKHARVVEDHAQRTLVVHEAAQEANSVERSAEREQRLAIFRQILDELPPRCREAFILHKLHGYSYSEVAARLGISQSGVEKHLIKALGHCRKRLKALLADQDK